MSSNDGPLVSHLLDVEELDPAELDAIPRQSLRRSLRRLMTETGTPTAEFLWWSNQNNDSPGGTAGRPQAHRRRSGERGGGVT